LPVTALHRVQEILQAPDDAMALALGISTRTLSRRRGTDTLTTDESDRLLQLAMIVALAQQALDGKEGARTWLRTPHSLLGGESPLQHMDTVAGMDQVKTLLYHIEYGLPV
jgi:putative toxin-antitoxin system antitoxin component (TIGR02293 family)